MGTLESSSILELRQIIRTVEIHTMMVYDGPLAQSQYALIAHEFLNRMRISYISILLNIFILIKYNDSRRRMDPILFSIKYNILLECMYIVVIIDVWDVEAMAEEFFLLHHGAWAFFV